MNSTIKTKGCNTNNITDVLQFIKIFSAKNGAIELFTTGCCYWFAHILNTRFDCSAIMYDPVANHFGCAILFWDAALKDFYTKIFDITGDVTKQYTWDFWSNITDPLERERVTDYCITFKKI